MPGRFSPSLTGIYFNDRHLTIVQLRAGFITRRILHCTSLRLPAGIVERQQIIDTARFAEQLGLACHAAGITQRQVALALSNQLVVSRRIRVAAARGEQTLSALVRLEAERTLPAPLASLHLDYRVDSTASRSDRNQSGKHCTVSLAAVQNAVIGPLLEACRIAGLHPELVTTEGEALLRGLAILRHNRHADPPLLAVAAEANQVSAFALRQDAVSCACHRHVDGGGVQLVADAALSAIDVCLQTVAGDQHHARPERLVLMGNAQLQKAIIERLTIHAPRLALEQLPTPETSGAVNTRDVGHHMRTCPIGLVFAIGLAACRKSC